MVAVPYADIQSTLGGPNLPSSVCRRVQTSKMPIHELFRASDSVIRLGHELAARAPQLSVTAGWSPPTPAALTPVCTTETRDAAERPWLEKEGYVFLHDALSSKAAGDLGEGVTRLVEGGFPPVFVYAFDEVWELGELLRSRVSAMLKTPYHLLEDVWAWSIDVGRSGWAAHRGDDRVVLDRSRPELLNVWVALSDAGAERACMHIVPLDDDPGYPLDLGRTDAPLRNTRAAPTSAGTALVWNANLLHWGGACSARAAGPRVSCSFSLRRDDANGVERLRPLIYGDPFDAAARLDLIARQILTYGDSEPDIPQAIREWASATCALRDLPRERVTSRSG
jgi:hypothetical protein